MFTFKTPAFCRKGILFALFAGGLLAACTSEEVAPQTKDQIIKTKKNDGPPGGNNGGGGGG